MLNFIRQVRYRYFGSQTGTIPSTDLYFANSCRAWIRDALNRPSPIEKIGANTFRCGDVCVVCRKDSDALIRSVLKRPGSRLIYIMDDDLYAAEADETLPGPYRERLIRLRDGQHSDLVEAADLIVVSSPYLEPLYRRQGKTVVSIPPYWSDGIPSADRYSQKSAGSALRLGYLGSASHSSDRVFVFEIFEKLLQRGIKAQLYVFGSQDVPEALKARPELVVEPAMSWPRYRATLRERQFDVLLYPSLDTPFNKARSNNKLIEHAVYGAPGLYSGTWQFADSVRDQRAGLTLPNDPDAWVDELEGLSKNSEALYALARGSLHAARDMNMSAGRQQLQLWSHQLDLAPPDALPDLYSQNFNAG